MSVGIFLLKISSKIGRVVYTWLGPTGFSLGYGTAIPHPTHTHCTFGDIFVKIFYNRTFHHDLCFSKPFGW